MRFDSFNEVVKWYNDTKPVVSTNHTKAQDVRPIGARNRKYERIKKIDDNTYALCDGNYGNCIWGSHTPEQDAFENTMAPILWMRREDGDFIRVRNHNVYYVSVTRYNFLYQHLPSTMHFRYNQQGIHWVHAKTPEGYVDFRLPKSRAKLDHVTKKCTDDNVYLMFRVNGDGTFTRVGEELEVEVKRVDKEVKKQWRERVDNFYTFCAAMAPMLDLSWGNRNEYANQVRQYLMDSGKGNLHGVWVRDAKSLPTDFMREVVTQEDHPMRVAVAALVVIQIGGKRIIESQDDIRSIRTAYNRLINQVLGFYKTEKV